LGAFYDPAADALPPPSLVRGSAVRADSTNELLSLSATSDEPRSVQPDLNAVNARRRLPAIDDFWAELTANLP
jgi:hypothetical protein